MIGVYRWLSGRFQLWFTVDGNKVSNKEGERFLKKLGLQEINEENVMKRVSSNQKMAVVKYD